MSIFSSILNKIMPGRAQAAPAALAWLRRTGADGVVVAGRPASRRTTRYVANVLSGADPSLLLVTRDVRAGAVAALSTGIVVDGAGLGEASGWLAAFDRELAESWAGVWLRSVTAVPAEVRVTPVTLSSLTSPATENSASVRPEP